MKAKEPEELCKILEKVCKKLEKKKKETTQIAEIFKDIDQRQGTKLSEHINSCRIYRKKLIIEVDTPTYLQELFFRKEALIHVVNQHFNKEVVKDIILKV